MTEGLLGTSFLHTATTSLIEEVDKRLLVVLRDGRKIVGVLRSFDQFANVVLENTYERIIVGDKWGEKRLGLFIIRGENVVLLGEIDDDKEHAAFNKMTQVSVAEIEQLSLEEKRIKDDQAKLKRKIMLDRGMNMETGFDDITQY
jgi:U6 snRNA-associated Sm-like protein LSm1